MTSKKQKPAPRERETGSESVHHCPTIDTSEINTSLPSIQVAHLISRFNLTPPRAALVAQLAFENGRAA